MKSVGKSMISETNKNQNKSHCGEDVLQALGEARKEASND
jgi:hypothetical protein